MVQDGLDGGEDGVGGGEDVEHDQTGEEYLAQKLAMLQGEVGHAKRHASLVHISHWPFVVMHKQLLHLERGLGELKEYLEE